MVTWNLSSEGPGLGIDPSLSVRHHHVSEENGVVETDRALVVIPDPQSPFLSNRPDCCEGVNKVNSANVCMAACLLFQGLCQTGLSGRGWASPDTKGWKAGRVFTAGTRCEGRTGDRLAPSHLQT